MAAQDPRADSLLPLPPAAAHNLMAVADEDRDGYAIIQDVAERTGGELKLSAGTLYRPSSACSSRASSSKLESARLPNWTTNAAGITGSRRSEPR